MNEEELKMIVESSGRPDQSSRCCVLALAPALGWLSDTSSLDRPGDINACSKCCLSALSGPKVSCVRHQCLNASGSAGERGAVSARGLLPEWYGEAVGAGWGGVGEGPRDGWGERASPPSASTPACCDHIRPKLTLTPRGKVKTARQKSVAATLKLKGSVPIYYEEVSILMWSFSHSAR